MKIKNRILLILKITIYCYAIIFFIGCFVDLSIDFNIWKPGKNYEVPLEFMKGIAIDNNGNVFCGTDFSRIQVYDNNGKFIRGWFFNSAGGHYVIKIDSKKNRLHIATSRGYMHYVYDVKGKLLLKERKDRDFVDNLNKYRINNPFPDFNRLITGKINRKNNSGDYRFDVYDNKGNLYMARGIFFPKIYKLTPNNRLTGIISVSWYKSFFIVTNFSWILFFLAAIVLGVIKKIEKSQREKTYGA